jgi:hypothetical protein
MMLAFGEAANFSLLKIFSESRSNRFIYSLGCFTALAIDVNSLKRTPFNSLLRLFALRCFCEVSIDRILALDGAVAVVRILCIGPLSILQLLYNYPA